MACLIWGTGTSKDVGAPRSDPEDDHLPSRCKRQDPLSDHAFTGADSRSRRWDVETIIIWYVKMTAPPRPQEVCKMCHTCAVEYRKGIYRSSTRWIAIMVNLAASSLGS